jgi:hypothetical protein
MPAWPDLGLPPDLASSTFVPTDSMPAAVQATALLGTTAWFAGLMAIFVPLAIRRYRALR